MNTFYLAHAAVEHVHKNEATTRSQLDTFPKYVVISVVVAVAVIAIARLLSTPTDRKQDKD